MDYLGDFDRSWVFEEGHCYISQMNDEGFVISMNFPKADNLK